MKKRDLYYERIPTKLLREDFRLLGTFLGKVIKDQEGKNFFNIVEKFRLISKNTLTNKNKRKVFSGESFFTSFDIFEKTLLLFLSDKVLFDNNLNFSTISKKAEPS